MSLKVKTGWMKARNSSGEMEDIDLLLGAGGSGNAEVTAGSIKSALGYTPADSAEVSSLKEDLSDLQNQVVDLKEELKANTDRITALEQGGVSGGGFTTEQTNLLERALMGIDFLTADARNSAIALIASMRGSTPVEPDPDEPPVETPVLASIGAVYNGENVLVGTALDNLRSHITVTGRYTDGSTQTITSYNLEGSIVEGSNTITVIVDDKRTTITVVGYTESAEKATYTVPTADWTTLKQYKDLELDKIVKAILIPSNVPNGSYTLSVTTDHMVYINYIHIVSLSGPAEGNVELTPLSRDMAIEDTFTYWNGLKEFNVTVPEGEYRYIATNMNQTDINSTSFVLKEV